MVWLKLLEVSEGVQSTFSSTLSCHRGARSARFTSRRAALPPVYWATDSELESSSFPILRHDLGLSSTAAASVCQTDFSEFEATTPIWLDYCLQETFSHLLMTRPGTDSESYYQCGLLVIRAFWLLFLLQRCLQSEPWPKEVDLITQSTMKSLLLISRFVFFSFWIA